MTKDVIEKNLRDDTEPSVRSGAVYLPMWIVGLLGILLYWGCNYIDARGGRFSAMVYEPYLSEQELKDIVPQDEVAAQLKQGKQIYDQFCNNCHQTSGAGAAGQYPPLAGSEWVMGHPNRLIPIPQLGLTGPIKVGGTDWNGVMPMMAGGGLMTDEQLAAVLTYIRNSFGNKAPAITAAEVHGVRAELGNRADPITAEELQKRPEKIGGP